MRARPKILLAENYEQAMELYQKFRPFVFGVLSDTRLPKKGKIEADAGVVLLSQIRKENTHIPLLMLSR